MVKRLVHGLLRRLGYAIMRPAYGVHNDAFDAQKELLQGDRVSLVLDVGANFGQTSQRYARAFANARIYAFEPDPESYAELVRRHGSSQPRIHGRNLAVSAKTGTARLNVNVRSSTNSIFETSADASLFVATELMERRFALDVESVALTDFCQAEGIEHVDVLKIDVQGAELLVLRGAEELLEQGKIELVYAEVLFAHLYEGQASFREVDEYVTSFGYRMYGLYDLNYGRNGMLAWADAIWLSPALASSLCG